MWCATNLNSALAGTAFCRAQVPRRPHQGQVSSCQLGLCPARRVRLLPARVVNVQLEVQEIIAEATSPLPGLKPALATTKPLWFAPSGQPAGGKDYGAALVGRAEPLGASYDEETVRDSQNAVSLELSINVRPKRSILLCPCVRRVPQTLL